MGVETLTDRDITQGLGIYTGTARVGGEPGTFVTVAIPVAKRVAKKPVGVVLDQRESVKLLASIARQVRAAWPAIGDELVAEALKAKGG